MGSESALLIRLIRNLSKESGSEQQRDRVKTELTENFDNVDDKLELIVENHYEKLKGTIHAFTSIAGRVTESQTRVKALKRSLVDCKGLLKCRREELKKLWMEGVECKQVLKLLDRIDEAKQAPAKLKEFMAAKQYLDATNLLVHMVSVLRGKLSEVDALRDLRMELESQKAKLYDMLLEELHRLIYVKSSLQAKRKMKASQENLTNSPQFARKVAALAAQKGLSHRRVGSGPPRLDASDLQLRESGHRDGEDTYNVLMIIECFAVLKKMPDAVQEVAVKMRSDMNGIIDRLTEQIADSAQRAGVLMAHQPRMLLELLQLCFDKFRAVAAAHSLVLSSFQQIGQKYGQVDVKLYKEADVWAAIQYSIQLMLSDYLDVQNATHNIHRLTAFSDTSDLSSYFAPRKKGVTTKTQKRTLFRFESSSYALSVRSYLREQREQRQQETGYEEEDLPSLPRFTSTPLFVCKPDMMNITVIFTTLRSFTQEIESIILSGVSMHCSLRSFIEDYVQLNFLEFVREELNEKLEAAIKGPDAQKTLADAATTRGTGSQRPLLQTAVVLTQGLDHLKSLMEHLPPYASDFLEMARDILMTYKDSCTQLFKAVLGATEDGQLRIISGMWARDEDIRRLLMSLPSWTSLKQQQEQQQTHRRTRKEMQESLETARSRHKQECDLLTRNLGDQQLSKSAIILDLDELRVIANLQESLDWLSERLQAVLTSIAPVDGGKLKHNFDVPVDLLRSVQQLHRDLVGLSEMGLLVLHLEIRCHCLYFLLPAARQSSYVCDADSMEPDENVVFLNQDLLTTEDVMSQALSLLKFKYLFEGIGYLIASILISSTAYLQKINANGIKRMCRNIFVLQQNLTNITMSREVDLDRARQYFELLFLSGEELLTVVVEQGPQFEEAEYGHALRLIARSQQRFNEQKLKERLIKLREILHELL
ncbi:exocyst complex component 4-like [Corticium candelabrum]|uniref:exocyst complex component 4-like n=1 Tax=Corticium candelabrum TaxID=121492 RepID=UPI002E2622FF|nr:exocyst complex component 4-like [Corticium candelabrum]